jgi:hypothetical protein
MTGKQERALVRHLAFCYPHILTRDADESPSLTLRVLSLF